MVFPALCQSQNGEKSTRDIDYRIDDWSKVIEFAIGTNGEEQLYSFSHGITLLEDWAIGGRVDLLSTDFKVDGGSVAPYSKYYFLDSPIRLFADVSSGLTINGVETESCKQVFFHYQLGGGIAYAVSRMGDPCNLEAMVFYRDAVIGRCGHGSLFMPAIKLSIYM